MRCSLGGLVGGDHLAVDYRFVDIEQPANLLGERVETTDSDVGSDPASLRAPA